MTRWTTCRSAWTRSHITITAAALGTSPPAMAMSPRLRARTLSAPLGREDDPIQYMAGDAAYDDVGHRNGLHDQGPPPQQSGEGSDESAGVCAKQFRTERELFGRHPEWRTTNSESGVST
jgi:hypothetical protein